MYASYHTICGRTGLLSRAQPFKGNTMSARYEDGDYVVYSYRTEIARVTRNIEVIIDETKYSRTTSKHQYYVRAWL